MANLFFTKEKVYSTKEKIYSTDDFWDYLKARKEECKEPSLTVEESIERLASFWAWLGYSVLKRNNSIIIVRTSAEWCLAGHPKFISLTQAVSLYNWVVLRSMKEDPSKVQTLWLTIKLKFPKAFVEKAVNSKPDNRVLKLQRYKGGLKVHE